MDKEVLRKKIENFWFYYKWYVVAGILLLLTVIVGVRSCNKKEKPDLYLLYARDVIGPSQQAAELETWLGGMAEDVNGDGETTAGVLSTVTKDEWNNVTSSAMLVQVNSGSAVLYLLTEENYQTLHENDVLQDLSEIGESAYIEKDRYCLTASGALEGLESFTDEEPLFLCLRKVEGTTYEGKAGIETQEQLAKDILKQLIAKEEADSWATLRKEISALKFENLAQTFVKNGRRAPGCLPFYALLCIQIF